MHGRPRKSPAAHDEAASAAKAEKLRALQFQFLSNHRNHIYTKEAVDLSAKLLETNPESYTAWNYRKLAAEFNLAQCASDPELVNALFEEELCVVENALRQNFKSYGAWHHRKWVVGKGHSSVEKELRLLDKFQSLDSRNFHAWNYRRFVTDLMERSEEDELEYTQRLIDNNFSNYSAWHNRGSDLRESVVGLDLPQGVLISSLMRKGAQGFEQKEEVLTREYELVQGALFTDEDDQSGWFYHLWLLDQTVKSEKPILVSSWPAHGSDINVLSGGDLHNHAKSLFNTFLFDSETFPLILYFNQAVEGVNSSTVLVESPCNRNEDLVWKSLSSRSPCCSKVWVTQLNYPTTGQQSVGDASVVVTLGHSQGIISSSGLPFGQTSQLKFMVHVQAVKSESSEGTVVDKISFSGESFRPYSHVYNESNPVIPLGRLRIYNDSESTASTWQNKIIDEEIGNFRELLDCKIGKLTLARLLAALYALSSSSDSAHSFDEILELYSDLMKVDSPHLQYYKDHHSMALLQKITSSAKALLSYFSCYGDLTSSTSSYPVCLRLNKLSLSRMGSFESLLWVQMLDLSQNELHSFEGLEALQLLTSLCLSKNKLRSFSALEPVKQLKALKALDISDNEIGAHSVDTTRYSFCSPLSHSAGKEWDHDGLTDDGASLQNYWEAFFVLKGLNLFQLDVAGNPIADDGFTSFLVKILPAIKWIDGVQLG